jgi:N-acetylglucosamine-6-phosphate deacetylase
MSASEGSGCAVGRIYQSGSFVPASMSWTDGCISEIEAFADDPTLPLIVPGFVDLHCHGGGGADFMSGGDAAHVIARTHARHGTRMLLATTMTAPIEDIETALRDVADAMKHQGADEAEIYGVHLEGPFISHDQLGAQPDFVQPATLALAKHFCSMAPIKVLTMAPEADPDCLVADWLRHVGVRVQIGHTACSYQVAREFVEKHADGATHLFNAMSGFHHRSPGCAGACLAHAEHAEIIPDLLHMEAGAIRAACRAIPNCYSVTDATAAAGMPDGEYRLGRQIVFRDGNAVRLASGGLAGSCLTMDQAFKNLMAIGLTTHDGVRKTSTIAAHYLGCHERHELLVGEPANFVIIAPGMATTSVVLRGNRLTAL